MSFRADVRSPAIARLPRLAERRGLTLIELLVVITIVATLAAVVAPAVFRHVGDAKSTAARAQLEVFALALVQYRLDNGTYPTTEQGLAALREPPLIADESGAPPTGWRGPYLSRPIPLDPWGRPYVYRSSGLVNPDSYDLYTLGRDGVPGGLGEDEDITSWGGAVTDLPPPPMHLRTGAP